MSDSASRPTHPDHPVGPNGEVGPVEHPETGEITHWGPHSTHVIMPGGTVVKIVHGEGVIPAKDGAPAVVLRSRKET